MAKVEVAEMQSSVHEKDKNVLEFMDSTDSYLVLMNSLSSSLRQVTISSFPYSLPLYCDLIFFFSKRENPSARLDMYIFRYNPLYP